MSDPFSLEDAYALLEELEAAESADSSANIDPRSSDFAGLLRWLLKQLQGKVDPEPPPLPQPKPITKPKPVGDLVDGLYLGGNFHIAIELRVDAGGSKVISADVYRTSNNDKSYVASLRTKPGDEIDLSDGQG